MEFLHHRRVLVAVSEFCKKITQSLLGEISDQFMGEFKKKRAEKTYGRTSEKKNVSEFQRVL